MTMRRINLAVLPFVLGLMASLPPATAAESPDPTVVARIQRLNRTATRLREEGDLEAAEKLLLSALDDAKQADLGAHPAVVAVHGFLGFLYSSDLKDDAKAIDQFKRALALKPDLKLNKARSNPDADRNFALARAEAGVAQSQAAAAPAAPAPAEAASTEGLTCPTSGEIAAGDEVTMRCLTAGKLRPETVVLFYKGEGQESFQSLPMRGVRSADETRVTWTVKIPADAIGGIWLPFYFEARDRRGRVLATSGRSDSPSLMSIRGGRSAGPDDDGEDEDVDDGDPLARWKEHRRKEREGSKGMVWFSLGAGSGVGYARGRLEAYGSKQASFNRGWAWAKLAHLNPEVGVFLNNNWALAVMGRNQFIVGGSQGTATGAHLAMLRILYFGDQNDSPWRFHGALQGGGGEGFRLTVPAAIRTVTLRDTVRGGPFVAGMAGGASYRLGSGDWYWIAEAACLVGFGNISVLFDGSTGIRVEF